MGLPSIVVLKLVFSLLILVKVVLSLRQHFLHSVVWLEAACEEAGRLTPIGVHVDRNLFDTLTTASL